MKSRIVRSFSGYTILILIPLLILFIYGMHSLNKRKRGLDQRLQNDLVSLGLRLEGDLEREWRFFLENEQARDFVHYRPLIVPDKNVVVSSGVTLQRSPLYSLVDHLMLLRDHKIDSADSLLPSAGLLPRLGPVLERGLLGYFEYDPIAEKPRTPYDPVSFFQPPSIEREGVNRYYQFLRNVVIPPLVERFGIPPGQALTANAILERDGSPLVGTKKMPSDLILPVSLLEFGDLESLLKSSNTVSDVEVKYHTFQFMQFKNGGNHFMVGYRLVEVDSSVLLQGFVFDQVAMAADITERLKPLQPEFGRVTVSLDNTVGEPLFAPFDNFYVSRQKINESEYLRDYTSFRNSFWISLGMLFIVITVSTIHLGRSVFNESRLVEEKNDFVSAITHELRAPLTSIVMYAEMLTEGWGKGKELKYYRYMYNESRRLSRLINNVLDFAKIERGQFKLNKQPLELNAFVSETLEALRYWIEEKGFKVEFDFQAYPTIEVDKDTLSQVIYNLCDNSIKYGNSAPEPRIKLSIAETESDAVLYFSDNGDGVRKEDEARIFDRFYRAESEMTRENTGTGIGLALVKEIIHKNGGTIELNQEAKKGFSLKITFPKIKG